MACVLKFLIFGIAMSSVTYAIPRSPITQSPELMAARYVSRNGMQFVTELYQKVKNKPGNILISPLSLQTVMALLKLGAEGETSLEIQRTIKLPRENEVTQAGFQQIIASILDAKRVTTNFANRIYVNENAQVKPYYKNLAENYFNAGIETMNVANPQGSANTINSWVEEKTNNKIKDLISPDQITSSTAMILVNALYFNGLWQHQFQASLTRDRDFHLTEQSTVPVLMMQSVDYYKYAENSALDCRFLEIPYEGREMSMVIVLPNKVDGLAFLENNMLSVLQPQQYTTHKVNLVMPKFTIETTVDMKQILKEMGMKDSFTADARFPNLLDNNYPLAIDAIIQKNYINVTESGTEAASATFVGVVTLSLPSLPSQPIKFNVDHPFIFLIRHKVADIENVIFYGRYVQQY